MRIAVVLSDAHPRGADPRPEWARTIAFVRAARDHGLDGVAVRHGWATESWNLQAAAAAAYLSAIGGPLRMAIRGVPLGVVNPIEIAERLATLDHAWSGRLDIGVAVSNRVGAAAHGLGPAEVAERFDEALPLVRAMWSRDRLEGTGPHFRFAEVRPTLVPFQPKGPPLALGVDAPETAARAARKGLGVHVEPWVPTADVATVVRSYHDAGGRGPVSVERGLAYDGRDREAIVRAVRAAHAAAGHDGSAPAREVTLPEAFGACRSMLSRWSDLGVGQVEVRLRAPSMAPGADILLLKRFTGSVVTALRS
jgi:alkanesulfonate monooxygenase SsuD/methylene tetrahydromethanopterin reductase-like flavin-dependent oxidoreductase (luciferase family)